MFLINLSASTYIFEENTHILNNLSGVIKLLTNLECSELLKYNKNHENVF